MFLSRCGALLIAFIFLLSSQASALSPSSLFVNRSSKDAPASHPHKKKPQFAAATCSLALLFSLFPGCALLSIPPLSREEIRERVTGDLKFFIAALRERRRDPQGARTALGILRELFDYEMKDCDRRAVLRALREMEPLFLQEEDRWNLLIYLRIFLKINELYPEDVRDLLMRDKARIEDVLQRESERLQKRSEELKGSPSEESIEIHEAIYRFHRLETKIKALMREGNSFNFQSPLGGEHCL